MNEYHIHSDLYANATQIFGRNEDGRTWRATGQTLQFALYRSIQRNLRLACCDYSVPWWVLYGGSAYDVVKNRLIGTLEILAGYPTPPEVDEYIMDKYQERMIAAMQRRDFE